MVAPGVINVLGPGTCVCSCVYNIACVDYTLLTCRIVRAFLIEEQKIVVRAVKAQQTAAKQPKVPKVTQKQKQQPKKK